MPDDWTNEHQLAFERVLTTLDTLSLDHVQKVAEALAVLTARLEALTQRQADTITLQAETIARQEDTIQRLTHVLECVRPGVVLLGEEDSP